MHPIKFTFYFRVWCFVEGDFPPFFVLNWLKFVSYVPRFQGWNLFGYFMNQRVLFVAFRLIVNFINADYDKDFLTVDIVFMIKIFLLIKFEEKVAPT